MTLIREIEFSKQNIVLELFQEFFQSIEEAHRPKSEVVENMLDFWSEGKTVILGKVDNEDEILGIVYLGLPSNRLLFAHARSYLGSSRVKALERELFDAGFKRLKEYESWVISGSPIWLKKHLIEYALDVGFKRYDTIVMTAKREAIEADQIQETPNGFTLEIYESQWKEEIAKVVFESFKDSPDVNAEPDAVSTLERCQTLVNDTVNGRYGNFRNGDFSWVLKNGSQIIGVALHTLQSEESAFAAGVCLKEPYRGKGLGKLMFIHSLRNLLEKAPKVNEIQLNTLSINPARHLYKSVGFEKTSEYSVYTWVKDENV
jgi:GNAT superfamily N-acetyltransferase